MHFENLNIRLLFLLTVEKGLVASPQHVSWKRIAFLWNRLLDKMLAKRTLIGLPDGMLSRGILEQYYVPDFALDDTIMPNLVLDSDQCETTMNAIAKHMVPDLERIDLVSPQFQAALRTMILDTKQSRISELKTLLAISEDRQIGTFQPNEWKMAALKVLDKLARHKLGMQFLAQDTNERYSAIVKHPQSLETIKKAIAQERITSTRHLHRDLLLMAHNHAVCYGTDWTARELATKLADLLPAMMGELNTRTKKRPT